MLIVFQPFTAGATSRARRCHLKRPTQDINIDIDNCLSHYLFVTVRKISRNHSRITSPAAASTSARILRAAGRRRRQPRTSRSQTDTRRSWGWPGARPSARSVDQSKISRAHLTSVVYRIHTGQIPFWVHFAGLRDRANMPDLDV